MTESSAPPQVPAVLRSLAAAYGVATEFEDWHRQTRPVATSTIRAVLGALGVDASDDDAAARSLTEVELAEWRRRLPPVVVSRQGRAASVRVVLPAGLTATLSLKCEDGTTHELALPAGPAATREMDGEARAAYDVTLPDDLPLGWHRVHLAAEDQTSTRLVVTPDRLELPAALQEGREWGFWLQLYALRSRRSWGMGDLGDLADLARWSAREHGAGFVLVNPLHAPEPVVPVSPSPYLPRSRRFSSPLYLRIEDLPEYAAAAPDVRADIDGLGAECARRNTTDDQLDRDAVWTAKRAALERLFAVRQQPERAAAYADYREREGQGLVDFAVWCALTEQHGPSWLNWPDELRDPRSEAVAQAAKERERSVDFYCWVQWVLDEQLAATRRAADEAGMPVGILHDLAVGVSLDSADAWALQDVLALGMSVGAPPDGFNQQGQDWSQPPWRPDRLAEAGYEPYRVLLRSLLRHSGGLRVDHILGLFRLWWVPNGCGPADGTYVTYDADALLGILALEAHRAGAVVVGEDLGVVPPGVRDQLRERGILGTSLLWFERDKAGEPQPPEEWRELALATVTTHDLPPTAGYLNAEHIRLRGELGLLTRSVEEESAANDDDLASWRRLLVERRFLAAEDQGDTDAEVIALHRLLAETPSRLIGIGLPDAAGDRRVINQPGTSDEYPNWRLPLADGSGRPILLEELLESPLLAKLATVVRQPRR